MSYPEHEKLQKVVDKSQEIGNFIEWIRSTKAFHFAKYVAVEYEDTDRFNKPKKCTVNELHVQPYDINALLAEYFGIDANKLEQEKCAMLEELRKANESVKVKKGA